MDFIKAASENLPTDVVTASMEDVVALLLEWDVPMKKARERTKSVLLHLSELVGFEEVQRLVPENYGHVMRNLRKLHRRNGSQTSASVKNTATQAASRTVKSSSLATAARPEGTDRRSLPNRLSSAFRHLSLAAESDAMEIVDLTDPLESRRLAKASVGMDGQALDIAPQDDGFVLPVNTEGRLVISKRSLMKAERQWRKRSRQAARASETDDGVTVKSTAPSRKSQKSRETKSEISKATKKSSITSHHSGQRFKAKKGAGGDVKGTSQLEPYAYWRLDRNLLNKRRGKRNAARNDLKKIGTLERRNKLDN